MIRSLLVLLALLPLAAPAAAESDDRLHLSGFGTLAHAWDDRDDLAPIRDITQRPEDGHQTGPTWLLDSRLGLQLAYRFSPAVEAVGQVVVRDQESDRPEDYVDLAYLGVLATPDLRVRLGRVGYDPFLMSDHRNLGYAYAWVRPPIEFYSWIPMFSLDGADLSYQFQRGDATWRLRAQAGQTDFAIPMGDQPFDFRAEGLWALSVQREQGPWRVKLGLSGFTSGSEVATLAEVHQGLAAVAGLGVPGISAEAANLRRETSFLDARLGYTTVGVAYDDGLWFGQAELGSVRTNRTIAPQSRNGYVVLGRRFDTLTPFVMLGISRPARALRAAVHDWSPLGPGAAGLQDSVYRYVVNSTRLDQETVSLGLRWDFDPRAALKLQWDHTRVHPDGYAAYFRDRPVLTRHAEVNLLTVSLDFVF
jgi:hypothetical protein